MKTNNQLGRSMIEILGVLAIIGVLSVGGIAGYSNAMRKQRLNNLRNQVSHIVAGVKQFYAAQGNFNDLTTEVAIKAGIIPSDMVIGDAISENKSPVKHIYNGDIWVEFNPNSEMPEFVVIIDYLPKDAVMDIGTANWSDDSDLVEIEIINQDE